MTRLTPLLTSLKTLNIIHQTPLETLLATPQPLPTSEPATPQISYTVAQADLPTFSFPVYRAKFMAYLVAAGYVTTTSSSDVYLRMKKNGVSVISTYAWVPAGNYYTFNCFFLDVAVGDVLEIALWADTTNVDWRYKAYQIQATRVIPFNKPRMLAPCSFSLVEAQPTLTLGYPTAPSPSGFNPCHCDGRLPAISSATYYDFLYPKDTLGMFSIYWGDGYLPNNMSYTGSTAYYPYYRKNYVPRQIIMRALRTEGQL
jgi:hypothetical protein